jgi:hypothetical protein
VEIYLRGEACHYKIEEKKNGACQQHGCLQATGPLLIFTLYDVLQVDYPASPPNSINWIPQGLYLHGEFVCMYML